MGKHLNPIVETEAPTKSQSARADGRGKVIIGLQNTQIKKNPTQFLVIFNILYFIQKLCLNLYRVKRKSVQHNSSNLCV